jgi:hypothetical protein
MICRRTRPLSATAPQRDPAHGGIHGQEQARRTRTPLADRILTTQTTPTAEPITSPGRLEARGGRTAAP